MISRLLDWFTPRRRPKVIHNHKESGFEEAVEFALRFESLDIGYLLYNQDGWEFYYSEAFKSQIEESQGIKPLVGFSDVNKVYESKDLWPFFRLQIPSLEQPSVKEILDMESIDKDNLAKLLLRFSGSNITSPFDLVAQSNRSVYVSHH